MSASIPLTSPVPVIVPVSEAHATPDAPLPVHSPDAAPSSRSSRLSARQRLETLFDDGVFEELDGHLRLRRYDGTSGDGVIAGHGRVQGRCVCAFAQDFSVCGGTLSGANGAKIVRIMDLAIRTGVPIVGLNDSAGGRIQEGVRALSTYGDIFMRNTQASGVVPQISAIMGPCAGGAAYSPALTDFTIMVAGSSYMFVTGPDVIRAVTQQRATKDDLGGVQVHTEESGVAHFVAPDDRRCLELVRDLLAFLPSSNNTPAPIVASLDPAGREPKVLDDFVPASSYRPYDVRRVIHEVVDDAAFLEVHETFARNLVVGFGRLAGRTVAFVANQPTHLAGSIDIDASVKGARFVRFCDAFNIPLVTFVDAPGFLPGIAQERGGIIRHGAKLLYAYAEATVPKVTVILRKAYGGAYACMASKHLGADFNFSWPSGQIAIMGPEAAVSVLYRREIEQASDPEACRARKTAEFRDRFTSPYTAATFGVLDEVIAPRQTRRKLIAALAILETKQGPTPRRKHGNIPL